MQFTNGFLAFIGESKNVNFNDALKMMEYRAWKGFDVRRYGSVWMGLCLTNSHDHNEIMHGELYDSISLRVEEDKLLDLLSRTDGNYALAVPDNDSIIFARDPLGTKPLYYAKGSEHFAVATDANSLSVLGLKPVSVEPGFLYRASSKAVERKSFNPILYETQSYEREEVIQNTITLLAKSVKKRIADRKLILGFGGGIDSTILAKLAFDEKIHAVTVCMKDSHDYKYARAAADVLNVDHEILLVNEQMVKDCVRKMKKVTEFRNAMHLSIACVVHLLAKYAKEQMCDALMLGQLADELFGGYARYVRYLRESEERAKQEMFNDVRNAYKDNFERDELASSFYTTLLLPYTSLDFVKYAVTIPLEMKLDKTGRRKIILREVGKKLGIPDQLLGLEKKAVQFSSGIYKAVKKLGLG
jgi:asparagine synthase (glutamine-hydrolysing)